MRNGNAHMEGLTKTRKPNRRYSRANKQQAPNLDIYNYLYNSIPADWPVATGDCVEWIDAHGEILQGTVRGARHISGVPYVTVKMAGGKVKPVALDSLTVNSPAIQVDPEFKALIRALKQEEYDALKESLLDEGCRDALVIWAGHNILVDGHNRYELCTRHNLPYKTVEREFEDRTAVILWMIQNQLARRNITKFARGELVMRMKEVIAEKARQKQTEGGKEKVRQNSDEPMRTDEILAGMADISRDTFRKVEDISTSAPESVKEAAREGDMSVNRAHELTKLLNKLPAEDRDRTAELCGDGLKKAKTLVRLYKSSEGEDSNNTYGEILTTGGFHYGEDLEQWCDFTAVDEDDLDKCLKSLVDHHKREARKAKQQRIDDAAHLDSIGVEVEPRAPFTTGAVLRVGEHILICNDNAVLQGQAFDNAALAFADPPYNADVDEWDTGDFVWTQDWLLDLAPVVAVTPGIGNIPGFMCQTQMPYRWSTSTHISNGMTRGALGFGNWLYTALFSKKSIHRNAQDIYTITINASDADDLGAKRQKPPMYLSWLFELLTKPGDTIIDAFGGSGTSVLVADKMGRRCVCVEKDETTFNAMVERIENALGVEAVSYAD